MTDEKRKKVLELLLKDCIVDDLIEKDHPQYLYKYRAGTEQDLDALRREYETFSVK